MPAEELTISVEAEGVDDATEALEDLADAADRANEALAELTVRVSSGHDDCEGVVDTLVEEFRLHGGESTRTE